MRQALSILLLLVVTCAPAQSVSGLFKKYKSFPEAQYRLVKGKKLQKLFRDSIPDATERERLKGVAAFEALIMKCSEEERQELAQDVRRLKDYKLLMSDNRGSDSPADENGDPLSSRLQKIFSETFNPSIKTQVYVKETKRAEMKDPLMLLDVFGHTSIIRIKCRMNEENCGELLKDLFSFNVAVDEGSAGTADFIERIRTDCVVAFDSEIMPDLHSTQEAGDYINKNHLQINGMEFLVGREAVKKEFPDLDADIVVKYVNVRPKSQTPALP